MPRPLAQILTLLVMFTAACDDASVEPCRTDRYDTVCAAVAIQAWAVCNRARFCGTAELETQDDVIACQAELMFAHCAEHDCEARYDAFEGLGACVEAYQSAACSAQPNTCEL